MFRSSAALAACGLVIGCVAVGNLVASPPSPEPASLPAPTQGTFGPAQYIPATIAARAYMVTHPARPVPGMTAGIVTRQLRDWPLPGTCPPHRAGAVGGPDMCFTWAYVVATTGGRLRISCGLPMSARHRRGVSCTAGSGPLPGDYVYIPDGGGKITSLRGVRTIRQWAIDVEAHGVPAGGA